MAKKCIPGVICIENMTLFVLVLIFLLLVYMYVQYISNEKRYARDARDRPTTAIYGFPSMPAMPAMMPIASRLAGMVKDPFNDPYAPPLKTDGYYFRGDSSDIRGIPPPLTTQPPRGYATGYSQVGILTRSNSREPLILPLMGRRSASASNKWQYYTISNSGNINTKLPVSANGRSCTRDVGCDEINNNDTVYVEGYKDTFMATVYETGTFSYNPYI